MHEKSNFNLIKQFTMKNKYLIIIVTFLTLLSCNQDEFLDKEPYDEIITEKLIIDFKTFKAAANGVYDLFQDTYYYNNYFLMLSDDMSDNVQRRNSTVFQDIDNYETTADDSYVQRVWDKIPDVIAQATIVIRQAKTMDFGADQDEATTLIGQLYIARSLAYFDMQRLFAQPYNFTADASHLGVPISDEVNVGIELISPARSTTAQVYDKIVTDINYGLTLIGDDTSSIYYFNKNSSKALLARIYLYMENWEEANSLATEVIAGGYSLLSTEDYVSSWTNDFTSESIFSIVNLDNDDSSSSSITYYYNNYMRFVATEDLYNSIDADDVRKNLMVPEDDFHKVLKYTASTRDDNIPVIRLSEMYLIQAEALAEMGGSNEDAARTAVNTIRLRANPTATPYSETGEALKDVIQDERRKELMFEGHRLFDLTRKKKDFVKYRYDPLSPPLNINYPNDMTILPIPQTEVDANENISEAQQNAGY